MIVDSVPTSLQFIKGLDWSVFSTPCRPVKSFIRGYDNTGFICYFPTWSVEVNSDFISLTSDDGGTNHSFKKSHEGYGWIRNILFENPSVRRFLREWDHHEHMMIPYETHTLRLDTMSFHS